MPASFDPYRHKNRESARKAVECYARLGQTNLETIRAAWGFPYRADWPYGPASPGLAGIYVSDPATSGD